MSGKDRLNRILSNWFFLFSFVPLLGWITPFMMNGHVKRKKWVIIGWIYILLIVGCFIGTAFSDGYYNSHKKDYPDNKPEIEDYLGDDYWSNENYKDTDEYKLYEEALKEYENTDEYKAAEENNIHALRVGNTIENIFTYAFMFGHFFIWILIMFFERYKYNELIDKKNKKERVYGSLGERMDAGSTMRTENGATDFGMNNGLGKVSSRVKAKTSNNSYGTNEAYETNETASSNAANTTDMTNSENTSKTANSSIASEDGADKPLNINTATQSQLEALPLVNIVDAKKIMEYRNEHGKFESTDQFFESFDAKPHVVVKLSKMIELESKEEDVEKNNTKASRRFDI